MLQRKIIGCLLFFISITIFYSCLKDEAPQTNANDLFEAKQETKLITYDQAEIIPGQYIVVFKENVSKASKENVTAENYFDMKSIQEAQTQEILSENKIQNKEIKNSYVKAINGFSTALSENELVSLMKDDRIAYIEQDQVIKVTMGGPPGGGGGGGGGTSQTTPWGVTRVGGAIDGTNAGTAWIIDSGIDMDHPDLNVDASRSQSFLSGGGGNTSPNDQNGHGTHVAGTVGAIDNSQGVIGVAAGATLVAVRVLDRRGSGSTSGVIDGVDYVAANAAGGDVANMSLGGGASNTLDSAVSNASNSCPFVLAAGNESTHANNSSPARVNGTNIYTVSSMTSNDSWSSFSNYGNPPVDYCAPGSSIYSTYKGGGYSTLSGTSMAAPHVAGIVLIGGITSSGNVSGDPDGNADPIAHH